MTVLIEVTTLDDIITSLNNELDNTSTWLKAKQVSINVIKTHYMVIRRSKGIGIFIKSIKNN